ncbi:MAG: M20/M25/M40 family metallo-hydrolase [Proteobacteria bacterium]|nr:M20/M25/M40 family metallo-hydrolase [Pseudomonadota bacterium]
MDKFGLNILEQFVLIDSGSENFEGVSAVQRLMMGELQKIGMKARLLPNPKDSELSAELLIAEKNGLKKDKYVTLVCHADTVYDSDFGFQGLKIDSEGRWANGPGVIDDKGGMVVALWGLKMFFEKTQGQHKFSYRLVSSPNEEVGSIGFHDLFREIGQNSEVILGFEPAFEDGAFVNRRQGNRWYEVKIQGREAHSGRDHAYGVNAGHELSIKLAEILALTNYEKGVTLSVAEIKAGTNKYNIVCGQAKAKIDMRFQDPKIGDETHQKILEILNKPFVKSSVDGLTASTRYRLADDCPPFNPIEDSSLYVEELRSLIRKHEKIDTPPPRRGAAADCCYMAREGILILDGMGPRGSGMHQSSERILISSLEARAKVLCDFLEFLEAR